ncbi:GNAT family N-acetyltransferase [Lentzea sp.]|uniref:GNAT family N-acetyltransferase n=1 Tax=Lentzea sp. TaxID=56099 RepID=UPI002C37A0B3|nr:GNAT family N-acetyltransferase [Lentzea sp.]HUQ60195.1 GNAT family N-acetyltransferase [Lentzea sp.]
MVADDVRRERVGGEVVDAARGRTGGLSLLGASRGSEVPEEREPGPLADIRDYETADEPSWLRCRVLGLLGTSHHDVWQVRHRTDLELVAAGDNVVIGLLDVSVPGAEAVIDAVAVHPDHQRRGLASALLEQALRRLERCGVRTLEAWVQDDPALAWFERLGFVETERHLRVHASAAEVGTVLSAKHGLEPVGAVLDVRIERETEMRQRFERVHVRRRVIRRIRP